LVQYSKGKEQEIIKLTKTILKQNYFQFNDDIYIQTEGLAMGAPTSATLSEIYVQYLEHTAISDALLQHKITGYYRYVDDILLVYDTRHTDINNVFSHFNTINKGIQITLEQEQNNSIHFLDLTITRTNNSFQFKIYRKPTTTDAINPADSCHPAEHKMSAIRYLCNRHETYMTKIQENQKENKIIKHILRTNKYNTPFNIKNKQRQNQENNPDRSSTSWARIITKLFRHTNVRIAYTTNNNIRKLLNPRQEDRHTDIYNRSGVYQLTCNACQKGYIGQTIFQN
jgi:hypothetical protein